MAESFFKRPECRQLDQKCREILFDWMDEVRVKGKIEHTVTALGLELCNEYLTRCVLPITAKNFQMLGIVCMHLAEGVRHSDYSMDLTGWVDMTAGACTLKDAQQMSIDVVQVVAFRLCMPTGWDVLLLSVPDVHTLTLWTDKYFPLVKTTFQTNPLLMFPEHVSSSSLPWSYYRGHPERYTELHDFWQTRVVHTRKTPTTTTTTKKGFFGNIFSGR